MPAKQTYSPLPPVDIITQVVHLDQGGGGGAPVDIYVGASHAAEHAEP